MILFRVLFDFKDDIGAWRRFVERNDRVAVRPFGLPLEGLIASERLADDGYHIGYHERRIEAHPELTDDVMPVLRFIFFLERQRAALRNDAEVVLQLFLGHPDPGIGNRQRAVVFISRNFNEVILAVEHEIVVGQRLVIYFIDRIAGIGDKLS
ncbi:hypothetical protein D3C77_231690 [compost metagenome]